MPTFGQVSCYLDAFSMIQKVRGICKKYVQAAACGEVPEETYKVVSLISTNF